MSPIHAPFTAGKQSRGLFVVALVASLAALTAAPRAEAQFTPGPNPIAGSVTTAQTLSGGTGTVNGSITIASGSTADVTVSGGTAGSPTTLVNNGSIQQNGTGRAVVSSGTNAVLVIQNNTGATISTKNNDTVAAGTGSTTVASVSLTNSGTIHSDAGGQAVNFNKILTSPNSVSNTGSITAFGSDAVRTGVNGTVYNNGTIMSTQVSASSSDGVDAQNNSGFQITNDVNGTIEGGRHGITGGAVNNTVSFTGSITNNAGGKIQGDNGSGINIDGFNNLEVITITNHGTITGNGVTADGDGVDVDGVVNLTNSGTIRSLNSFTSSGTETSEGVTVGGGTIINTGTIQGSVASGNTSAVGRGITLAGVDKDASGNPIPVQGIYANSTVTNSGLIKGDSDSGIAVLGPATGFTVTINNQAGGVIEGAGATAATIQTGDDNDTITNAGSIINDGGNTKTAISMGGGNDSLTVTGGSAVIVGGIDGGTGTNTLTFDLGAAVNAFTHSGTISNFATVEVKSGQVSLNGNNIYAGTTSVGGGAIAALLSVNGSHTGGGAYEVKNNGTLRGTGSIALASAATLLTVDAGGTLHPGSGRLTIDQGSVLVNGTLAFDLNGTSAGSPGGYDQLTVGAGNGGSFALGTNSSLLLNLGFTPLLGQQFELIDVANGLTGISGHFAGLTEGADFSAGGTEFQITYAGGTGNDVVLTTIPEPATTTFALGGLAGLVVCILRRTRRAPATS